MADVEALWARAVRARLVEPDPAGLCPAHRWAAADAQQVLVEDLHQDVSRLEDAIAAAELPADDPRRVTVRKLFHATDRLVGQAQRRESAAENAWLRSIGHGAEVDRRIQARAAIFSHWSAPTRAQRKPCAARLKPRRRGAGRPRAQAARSSVRSGSSGDDGPSHPGSRHARSAT